MHVRDQMYTVHCGDGSQKIRWLCEVAAHRYDPDYLFELGPVADVKLKEGKLVDMEHTIIETLQEEAHMYVQFSEDIAAQEKLQGDKKNKRR